MRCRNPRHWHWLAGITTRRALLAIRRIRNWRNCCSNGYRGMLRHFQNEITINTRGRGFYDLTEQVGALLAKAGLKMGQVTLHVQHTSASLVIQENADPEVRR